MTLFSDILSIPSNPEDIFTLLYPIGSGAFGKVYKAMHNETEKIYAIKIIKYFKEENKLKDVLTHIDNINYIYKNVQQETSLMRILNSSKYIVKYYGSYFSRRSNTLWLILEYCSSGSVIDLMLSMDRSYNEIEIATIIKMILNGLIIIHKKNLIHRDIKGSNILLSEDGFAKIADFGVAAKLECGFRNSQKGSPYWMSPQIILNKNYDYKTDIWSLGMTCIEMIKGEPPNSFLSPKEVMSLIGKNNLNVNKFFDNCDYSKEFKNFVECCLKYDPTKRLNAIELLKHEFIVKFAKNENFIKKLIDKHKNDVEIYRKEVEQFEKNMLENEELLTQNEKYGINTSVKIENLSNNSIVINNNNNDNFLQSNINDDNTDITDSSINNSTSIIYYLKHKKIPYNEKNSFPKNNNNLDVEDFDDSLNNSNIKKKKIYEQNDIYSNNDETTNYKDNNIENSFYQPVEKLKKNIFDKINFKKNYFSNNKKMNYEFNDNYDGEGVPNKIYNNKYSNNLNNTNINTCNINTSDTGHSYSINDSMESFREIHQSINKFNKISKGYFH